MLQPTPYERICFGNLEFAVTNDSEPRPIADTLISNNTQQLTPEQQLPPQHEQANCPRDKRDEIVAQVVAQRAWLYQSSIRLQRRVEPPLWYDMTTVGLL
jgi:hypothetical protein